MPRLVVTQQQAPKKRLVGESEGPSLHRLIVEPVPPGGCLGVGAPLGGASRDLNHLKQHAESEWHAEGADLPPTGSSRHVPAAQAGEERPEE